MENAYCLPCIKDYNGTCKNDGTPCIFSGRQSACVQYEYEAEASAQIAKQDANKTIVYEMRRIGREYCDDTEGSEHYKGGGMEPIDLYAAKGMAEDFFICNMIKYAVRFKKTRNLDDLKKVSDYAHLMTGLEIMRGENR